jgi:predicted Zn-dependent peptidase
VFITHRPVSAQVEVTFACRLPYPKTTHERAAQRTAASVLGGYLTEQIREQGGASYSIDSTSFVAPGGAAHIAAGMSVDSRRLRDVLRVLHEQVDHLARGGIDKPSLSQVQWGLTRGAALRFQTSSDLAEEILQTITQGLPLDAIAGDVDEVARVTPSDVQRIFAACNEGTVLSLVGDQTTIRGAL